MSKSESSPCCDLSEGNAVTFSPDELLALEKPAQYLGGELNSVIKDEAAVDLRFALCFPDTYEVGMSHIGMQILYHIVNSDPTAWAERVYMPARDMESLLRTTERSLFSLEAKRPLCEFDLVGFSLQYELCATNILAMLELGGIPLHASDRTLADPIVIGGGPWTYHPEPIAPFFDLFFIGDAEEALPELIAEYRSWVGSGKVGGREELLKRFDTVAGVYVPSFYEAEYDGEGFYLGTKATKTTKNVVVKRLLPSMAGAPYPTKPVVPNIKAIHNRLSIEVMRGCVRGCRFCQAGYLYRPQRERPPEEVLKIIEESLPETGYEELSLLSLSTADYCSIVPVLSAIMDRYGDGEQLAVSFPSTRVDALTPEVLSQVQRVRRTNFTVAPEGGTQRIRDVINKGVTDEQILETCRNVFSMGWSGIKLYFMIGLPTETDEDVLGIAEIAERVKRLPEAQRKDITVSVSTHVPKPHTPFQWSEQISQSETVRKQRLLAVALKRAGVNFRYHDAFSTYLEGVFCRAGREFSAVIERAYQLGCRLDAWTEELNREAWMQAIFECGINAEGYFRERSPEEPLPWDHLSCGISKEYFLKEYRRALRDRGTPDCLTQSCSVCGACDYDTKRNVLYPRWNTEAEGLPRVVSERLDPLSEPVQRLRLCYHKTGVMRFVGHLEFAQLLQRACRRAELPLGYSAGFHPFPKIGFASPLQLGVESESEYCDLLLVRREEPEQLLKRLGAHLPDGFSLSSLTEIPLRHQSLQEEIVGYRFVAEFIADPRGPLGELLSECGEFPDLSPLLSRTITRKDEIAKRGKAPRSVTRSFILRDTLSEVRYDRGARTLSFHYSTVAREAQPRPTEILSDLTELSIGEYRLVKRDTFFSGKSSSDALRERLLLKKAELQTGIDERSIAVR